MKSYSFLKKYLLAATATAALLFSACDLDEHPTSFVGPKEYYKTRAQCLAGLNACYIPINSIYDYCFLIMTEGVTDLMYIASGTKDAQLDISPAKPLNGQKIWTQCYKGVMYCNSTIAAIERSPLNDIKESSEADKLPLLAEGVVIRSFYYWLLTCIFGDVPFYTKEVADQQVMQEIAHMGRMSAKETRDYLIDELQRYVPSMDQVRSSEVADNRMGAAMGWMMIAKLAQWNHRWDDALEALGELEKIYGDLQQYPLEDIMFRNKNTPESIFEVQRTYTPGGLSVTTNVAAITTPYHNGKGIYDGVEIPEMGTGMTTWTSMRPNSYFCDGLQTKKSNDKRKTLNMAWEYDGKPFSGVGTRPWLGPKFWCPGMQNTADFSNQKVFRYADAILMMAEIDLLDQLPWMLSQLREAFARYDMAFWEMMLFSGLVCFVRMVSAIACIYAACMVGHQFKSHPALAGILSFFGMQYVQGWIEKLLRVGARVYETALYTVVGDAGSIQTSLSAQGFMGCAALTLGIAAAFGVFWFGLTVWLMRNRLNME